MRADLLPLWAGAAVVGAFALYWWRVSVRRFRRARWQGDAKARVGRAVEAIRQEGHALCHQVTAAGGGTIDHLLAGPKGVFTIHTLVTPPPAKADKRSGAIVVYDGRTLRFPHGEDHRNVREAEVLAEQLSQWLSRQLDAPVAARAVLVLPGWQVKRTSSEGISVLHPDQLASFFRYVKPRPLAKETVRQIARLLDSNGPER